MRNWKPLGSNFVFLLFFSILSSLYRSTATYSFSSWKQKILRKVPPSLQRLKDWNVALIQKTLRFSGSLSQNPIMESTLESPAVSAESSSMVVYGTNDKLFGSIEDIHFQSGKQSFGSFLDAGTGSHSLRWMASLMIDTAISSEKNRYNLTMDHYTAITADEGMRSNVYKEALKLGIQEKGSILIGNWQHSKDLLKGKLYDTILADYLVGAMDGFSPYYQDLIFPRLSRHLKPGGRLYVVGLQPIPHHTQGDANIFCKVTRLRDACILLAGHRCYREYPVDWIERHLEKAGLKVIHSSTFPIMYSHSAIVRQLNVARSKLPFFESKELADKMGKEIDRLEQESKEATDRSINGRLKLGFDYVVTAEMPL